MAVRTAGSARKAAVEKQESVGARMARLRRERGLSQTEFGERIGVSQRVMSHYENDEIRIPADMLLKAGNALKVSIQELLGAAPSPPVPKNRKLWKLVEEIEALPPGQQRALLTTIGTFLKGAASG